MIIVVLNLKQNKPSHQEATDIAGVFGHDEEVLTSMPTAWEINDDTVTFIDSTIPHVDGSIGGLAAADILTILGAYAPKTVLQEVYLMIEDDFFRSQMQIQLNENGFNHVKLYSIKPGSTCKLTKENYKETMKLESPKPQTTIEILQNILFYNNVFVRLWNICTGEFYLPKALNIKLANAVANMPPPCSKHCDTQDDTLQLQPAIKEINNEINTYMLPKIKAYIDKHAHEQDSIHHSKRKVIEAIQKYINQESTWADVIKVTKLNKDWDKGFLSETKQFYACAESLASFNDREGVVERMDI